MGGELSTEQVLLLNNLMYMTNDPPMSDITEQGDCWSVGDIVQKLNDQIGQIQDGHDYGSFMTGSDWKNLIHAVQADQTLMDVQLVQTHSDPEGGGVSALFTNPSTNEAVVVFRGTAPGEWKDNFIGGAATNASDGVSTPCQKNALDWYQDLDLSEYDSVTVSGHSKGGNKAKYVAILDGSADRCLSFDGQGFSDEFIAVYGDEIAARQYKIENHNVGYDYVNLLLNDVGAVQFYEGQDLGAGGFAENHCPNTFLVFGEDGSVTMVPGERAPEMAALDEFLNSYLRSLPPEEKRGVLELFGNLADIAFNSDDMVNDLVNIMLRPESAENCANLVAYLSRYAQENPELAEQINHALAIFGMGDFTKVVNTVEGILNWEHFDKLLAILGIGGDVAAVLVSWIPDPMMNKLLEMIESGLGITLSRENLITLLGFISQVSDARNEITMAPNQGGDLTVSGRGRPVQFGVCPDILLSSGAAVEQVTLSLDQIHAQIEQERGWLNGSLLMYQPALRRAGRRLERQISLGRMISRAAQDISASYLRTEKGICAFADSQS